MTSREHQFLAREDAQKPRQDARAVLGTYNQDRAFTEAVAADLALRLLLARRS